jgi:hypothetical protein
VTNILIREWLNGGLIPLNICIIIIISYTLWLARKDYGPGWSKQPGVSSACALWWLFFSDLIRSVLAWQIIHAQRMGRPLDIFENERTVIYIVIAAIATAATFRLIYTLSPDGWGHKAWIFAAVVTAGLVAIMGFIP